MDKNPLNIFIKWLDKGFNSSFWTHCYGFLSWHNFIQLTLCQIKPLVKQIGRKEGAGRIEIFLVSYQVQQKFPSICY